MTLDEKLEHFYSSVIDSATKQNIEIVEEYRMSLQKNYNERKEAAIHKAEASFKTASDHITREKNRKLSAETMDIRRKVLDQSSEYTDQIFLDVKNKLYDYMKTTDYDNLLYSQIKKATDFANGDAITIYLNPSDISKKPILEEKAGISITMSNRDFIGGVRAVIPSHSILIDYSFITKLEEIKSSFTL